MRSNHGIILTEVDQTRLQAIIDRAAEQAHTRQGLENLQRELDRAEIVDSKMVPAGLVVMNSTVSLRDLESDEIETYELVYPQHANISLNRVSVLAPVGTAIIGCQVGDVVTWPVPRGQVRLRIEEVVPPEPQGERTDQTLVAQP